MPIVRLPDGTLAHFEDGVSPEELRRYVVPDVPDAVTVPGSVPGDDQVPIGLGVPNLPSRRRLPGEIGAGQVPFDLMVPNLPSSRRLPGEINHSVPGMPLERSGEPVWDFHPFPVGDDGGAFRKEILSLLAEEELNRAQPPSSDPAPSRRQESVQPPAEEASPPASYSEISGSTDDVPISGLWENIGAGLDSGVNKLLGIPVDFPVWAGNYLVDTSNMASELAGYGRPIQNIPTDLPGSSAGWERTQEALGFTPPSKVVPADDWQRLARAGAENVAMAVIPELFMMKFGQAATTLPTTADLIVEALYGRPGNWKEFASDMGIEAAAGAATEWTPDWLDPYVKVLSLFGPSVAEKTATSLYGG